MGIIKFNAYNTATKRNQPVDIQREQGNYAGTDSEYAESLNRVVINLLSDSFVRNLRLPNDDNMIDITLVLQGNNRSAVFTVACSDSVTRNLIVKLNGTSITPVSTVSNINSGDVVTLKVPFTATYELTVTLSATDSASREIKALDMTEYNHDFGARNTVPVSFVKDGKQHLALEGDFFVASEQFDSGNYKEGVPYKSELESGSLVWREMQANVDNSERMLKSLATILSDDSIQPAVSALYGWFKNLVALEAVIENLTARNITVTDVNNKFVFRANAYYDDGTRREKPIVEVRYNNEVLFSVDPDTGRVSMSDASVSGDFSSTGFATSKAGEFSQTVSASSSSLNLHYLLYGYNVRNTSSSYVSSIASRIWDNLSNTVHAYSYPQAVRDGFASIGVTVSFTDDILTAPASGTFNGQQIYRIFGEIGTPRTSAYLRAGVYNVSEYGACLFIGWTILPSFDSYVCESAPMSSSTNITFTPTSGGSSITVTGTGSEIGYLLTSSYLSGIISTYSLPVSSDLKITSASSVSINGISLIGSISRGVFINISSASLEIYDVDTDSHKDNTATFYTGDYLPSTAFVISNAQIETSVDGIKTMHVVPYSNSKYNIGTSANRFKAGYFDSADINTITNSPSGNSIIYGAVFN